MRTFKCMLCKAVVKAASRGRLPTLCKECKGIRIVRCRNCQKVMCQTGAGRNRWYCCSCKIDLNRRQSRDSQRRIRVRRKALAE